LGAGRWRRWGDQLAGPDLEYGAGRRLPMRSKAPFNPQARVPAQHVGPVRLDRPSRPTSIPPTTSSRTPSGCRCASGAATRGCRFARPPAHFCSPSRGMFLRKVCPIPASGLPLPIGTNRLENPFHGRRPQPGVRRHPPSSHAAQDTDRCPPTGSRTARPGHPVWADGVKLRGTSFDTQIVRALHVSTSQLTP